MGREEMKSRESEQRKKGKGQKEERRTLKGKEENCKGKIEEDGKSKREGGEAGKGVREIKWMEEEGRRKGSR